jgi:hypothetical protein
VRAEALALPLLPVLDLTCCVGIRAGSKTKPRAEAALSKSDHQSGRVFVARTTNVFGSYPNGGVPAVRMTGWVVACRVGADTVQFLTMNRMNPSLP